jgi:hypothetical protein
MIHPLAEDFSQLKDTEIENKIQELGRKYFQCNNPALQHQITLFLDMYKTELAARRARTWQEQYQKRDTDLDSLININ